MFWKWYNFFQSFSDFSWKVFLEFCRFRYSNFAYDFFPGLYEFLKKTQTLTPHSRYGTWKHFPGLGVLCGSHQSSISSKSGADHFGWLPPDQNRARKWRNRNIPTNKSSLIFLYRTQLRSHQFSAQSPRSFQKSWKCYTYSGWYFNVTLTQVDKLF